MSKETTASSSGLGLSGILTIIFVVAKLLGLVAWSWWWVFSPLLISTGLAIAILIAVFGVAALVAILAAIFG